MPTDTDAAFHRITRGSQLLGFIAIDSTIGGRARGGLRIAPDVSEDEIRAAARAMTLKYGLLGLPQGGAKAGIIGDAEASPDEKRRLLEEFARNAAPLLYARQYVPDPDLGTSADDVRTMMAAIGAPIGPRDWRANRSGEYTAHSVLAAVIAVMERQSRSLAGCRVAVEGFGKVGSSLAGMLAARGARIVALSTSRGALHSPAGLDVARLIARVRESGSRFVEDEPDRIERGALLELPVDLLLPCARHHSIHAGNVARVAAAAICAGANDPVSPEAEAALFVRGIPYPPDFISNCGGVLGGTLEFASVGFERITALIDERVGGHIRALLTRAEHEGVSPRTLAEREALAQHARIRAAAAHPDLAQRLVGLAIEGYRRRWIPEKLVAMLAPHYLARGIG